MTGSEPELSESGPTVFCQRMLPEKESNAKTRDFVGKTTYTRPLFPGVTVKNLSTRLKS